jgi:AcrR family transcriptional regulator
MVPGPGPAPAIALEPKRQRGRLRVEAILDAGAEVFAEKGYDAATMTEIAARSNTAIGSLYRFFPTKAVVADALIGRYGDMLREPFDTLEARAAGLSAVELADALFDQMVRFQSEKSAALALLEGRSETTGTRTVLREEIRRRLTSILARAGGAAPAQAEVQAMLLLHVLKFIPLAMQERSEIQAALLAEARALARQYVSDILQQVR